MLAAAGRSELPGRALRIGHGFSLRIRNRPIAAS